MHNIDKHHLVHVAQKQGWHVLHYSAPMDLIWQHLFQCLQITHHFPNFALQQTRQWVKAEIIWVTPKSLTPNPEYRFFERL